MPPRAPLLALLLLAPTCARAYAPHPTHLPSLELLIPQFDTVARGRIVVGEPSPSRLRDLLTIEVTETLRGYPPRHLKIEVRSRASWDACVARGGDVIVCTDEQPLDDLGGPPLTERLSWSWGSTGGFNYANDVPLLTGRGFAVFDLTTPHDATFSMTLKPLHRPADVLDAVRATARLPRPPVTFAEPLRIPLKLFYDGPPPRRTYYPTLLVPNDARLADAARAWVASPDPRHRTIAATLNAPRFYPGHRQTVRPLLADSHWVYKFPARWPSDPAQHVTRYFPVRAVARVALPNADHAGAPPVDEPHFRHTAVRWRWPVGAAGFALAVLAAARRARPGRRLRRSAALLSLALCAASAGLWVRSHARQDALTLATATTDHEITSLPGRLAWLRVDSAAGPRPAQFRTESQPSFVWFHRHLQPAAAVHRVGLHTAVGRTSGPADLDYDRDGDARPRYPFSYRLLELPYWLSTALFAAWPLFCLGAAGTGRARRWRRARHGQCPHCGYDRRAQSAAVPCPECGTPLSPAP